MVKISIGTIVLIPYDPAILTPLNEASGLKLSIEYPAKPWQIELKLILRGVVKLLVELTLFMLVEVLILMLLC